MSSTPDYRLALRVVTLPRDTNQYGTIFGGVILSYIDQAGFIEARTHGIHRWVTASIDRVDFTSPVHVGDVVSFKTRTLQTGSSSVQVEVHVEAERYSTGEVMDVTRACLTMVSVDRHCRPIPFNSPASTGDEGGRGA